MPSLTLLALAALSLTTPSLAKKPCPFSTFNQNIIATPSEGGRYSYPRIAETEAGALLVISGYFQGPNATSLPVFPVFESLDGGVTWEHISDIEDQVNGVGMGAHPAIVQLDGDIGGYPAGTIIAAGNSWSFGANGTGFTRLDVYASLDLGRSWEFVSRCAEGGRPNTTNGADPVWEPFLLEYEDEVVCYYSDQRDPDHGQKLPHQTSADLQTWGPVVDDVALEQYIARPGMQIVAYLPPIDKWIVTYELPIGNSSSYGAEYPVHYRLADDPLEFQQAEQIPILVDGKAPNASPYVVWSPSGGPMGTIIVSDADHSEVFTNTEGGDRDAWEMHATGQPDAYSRALHVFEAEGLGDHLVVVGGDTFNGRDPRLSLSVVSVEKVLMDYYTNPEV